MKRVFTLIELSKTLSRSAALTTGKAFTLIELLVVVTILVVLLALLVPALDRAMEQAVRAACGANMNAWGIAVAQYSIENKNRLLSSARYFSVPGVPYPHVPFVYSTTKPGSWSVEAMRLYARGISGDLGSASASLGGIWYCPGSTFPGRAAFNDPMVRRARDWKPNPPDAHEGPWLQTDYAYFARAESWKEYTPWAEELTDGRLAPGRLLMADTIFIHPSAQWYNHGELRMVAGTVPQIPGQNQLTGDGAVQWKPFDSKRNAAVPLSARKQPDLGHYVSGNKLITGDLTLW